MGQLTSEDAATAGWEADAAPLREGESSLIRLVSQTRGVMNMRKRWLLIQNSILITYICLAYPNIE